MRDSEENQEQTQIIAAAIGRPTAKAPTNVDANAVAALRAIHAGGHTDLYSKLVDLFRSSSTRSIAELAAALERDDLPAAATVCHKLASAATNVGALAYGQQAKKLERYCLAGERARACEACRALQAAHTSLLETLQNQRQRASA